MLATIILLFELIALAIGLVFCVYIWEDYPSKKMRFASAISFIGILCAMILL